jgi:polyisoprenoid-binding protein YceI
MPALPRPPLLALLALALLAHPARGQSWTVEDASTIGFTATQQGQPVAGRFERFTAEIVLDPAALADSRIDVVIDTGSIATGHKDRDAALRSASFFEVERWPTARFTSEEIVHEQGDRYLARGQLTIRDVTREVTLPFELTTGPDPDAADRLRAAARGELSIARLDYGVGQGDFASTRTIGDEVVIRIALDATRPR